MSKCLQCNIEVLDETERCPLCKSALVKTIEVENMYPDVKVQNKRMMFFSRVYLFAAIVIEVLLICINYFDKYQTWWSLIVGLGLLYEYIVIRMSIVGRTGHRAQILILTLMAVLSMVAVDFLLGYRGWSINYAIPIAIIVLDAGILILMICNRRNWQAYLMFQLFLLLASAALGMLCFLGILTKPYLVGVAFLSSAFLFLGTVILGDRRARVELYRRFHI